MSRDSGRFPQSLLIAAAAVACSPLAVAAPSQAAAPLSLSAAVVVKPQGGSNPTVAVDRRSGKVYVAWAQENSSSTESGYTALLARSDDGGRHFGTPVVVSTPQDHVATFVVSPTRVAVGHQGEVYVLYENRNEGDPRNPFTQKFGQNTLRLAISRDGGKSFASRVEIGNEKTEGVLTSLEMLNLFVSPQGGLYASFLDYRNEVAYGAKHGAEAPKDQAPSIQLRVARSTDGGKTFGKTVLVSEPTCGCCGTQVAQGTTGPLYATTRSAWRELKGSMDEVRDLFISTSGDQGQTWSKAAKIHNDGFKISGCPDVTSGLVVDSRGRLHAAWYTGTDRHPGVFYARSDDQGKTFSQPLQLLSGDWIPYSHVKLAVDGEDTPWVAFADRRGDEDMIQVARVAPDGTTAVWSQSWVGIAPDVAALERGAIVTWSTKAPAGQDSGGGEIKTALVQTARGS